MVGRATLTMKKSMSGRVTSSTVKSPRPPSRGAGRRGADGGGGGSGFGHVVQPSPGLRRTDKFLILVEEVPGNRPRLGSMTTMATGAWGGDGARRIWSRRQAPGLILPDSTIASPRSMRLTRSSPTVRRARGACRSARVPHCARAAARPAWAKPAAEFHGLDRLFDVFIDFDIGDLFFCFETPALPGWAVAGAPSGTTCQRRKDSNSPDSRSIETRISTSPS